MKQGHIFIDGIIEQDDHLEVKQKLAALSSAEEIVLHIQSPGGSVYGGYKIYHALKSSGKKITAIIEGEAQSMATFISLAADKIIARNPSVYMIHNPSNEIQGDADAMESGANELRNIETDMLSAYAEKTKLPVDQIREMMRKTTTLTAYKAKELGFVDEVIQPLKAVAIGKSKMKDKNLFATLGKKIAQAFSEAGAPVAIDLKTKDGKMLMVDSENGDLVGKPAFIDGVPAEGDYALEDGRMIVCAGGVVTAVKEAPTQAAPPAPAQAPPPAAPPTVPTQDATIATLKAQLEAAEQAKATADAAKAEADKKLAATVTALGEVKTEVEKIKKQTVGDDDAPDQGMIPNKGPVAIGAKTKGIESTMTFLNEHMSWLKQYYPEGHFEKYAKGPNMVSILETNFNYTYPGILTTEIFYKPTLQAPALSDIFTIDQGIKDKKRYNLVNQLDKILKPYTGCTRVFNNNTNNITNTTVQTKEFNVSESWCKDDFTDQLTGAYNHLAQEWLKTGNRSFDPSGTPINTIIDRILVDALQRDVFRRASFAAGNSSDDDYNQFDGLWDRLIDSSGASNYCVVRAGSALGTGTLAAGAALTALEAVYAGSNILLKNAPGKKFWVTRSIWDNYYNSLIGTGAVTEQAFENLQKGLTTLTYKGIPVIPVDLWDQFLAESDNPLFATTRHLILLTIKENHILGVEQASDLNKIEGWYERKDRKFYYEADMKFGYNYLHCDLQTIAY